MVKIKRDIGFITPKSNQPFIIPQSEVDYIKRTQVYRATHDGEDKVLPYRLRSFISFTFGGKKIEDFGVIRVTGGDRMSEQAYTNFQDLVSQYEVLDGQFYWGTHYKPLELNYTLSTDNMTQRQLDQFKAWFAPGKQRELIRAEHPNRAILARVREAPSINMLPFEGQQEIIIAQTQIKVPTTIYKGDITIGFVADDPFWYSLCNLLGNRYKIIRRDGQIIAIEQTEQLLPNDEFLYYQYRWYDANEELVETFSDKDALKIILQDNIPTANMIRIFSKMFLGDNNVILDYQGGSGQDYSGSAIVAPAGYSGPNANMYAHVGYARVGKFYAPATGTLSFENSNIDLSSQDQTPTYLYYAGNAISHPIVKFKLTPILSDTAPYYIINPGNKYGNKLNENNPLYNLIVIQSQNKHEFKFSTPSAWNGYNQAMSIFKQLSQKQEGAGTALTEVKVKVRDGINHNGARAWAIGIVQYYQNEVQNGNLTIDSLDVEGGSNVGVSKFYSAMKLFIGTVTTPFTSSFTFNFKNGECDGKLTYRNFVVSQVNNSFINSLSSMAYEEHEEKVGDMVKSSYLFLEETNRPNEDGLIVPWSQQNKTSVHKITTDYPKFNNVAALTDFSIQYKNMYL